MARIRLWTSVWLERRRIAQLEEFTDDCADLWAAEEYAQVVYATIGEVIAQLWQVEAGVVEILRTDAQRRRGQPQATVDKLEALTFGGALRNLDSLIDQAGIRSSLQQPRAILTRALESRNRLTHGRLDVGVARRHPDAPPEPVIVTVSGDELDERAERALATEAMDAVADIAVALEKAGCLF